ILAALLRLFGMDGAQRLAVSIAVLAFVWGAFAFVNTVSGRRSWHLLPCIAIFAYGWVFHMGFFNFYLSMGLCFWAISLAWELTPRRLAAAAGLLPVAYMAHALPVAWSIGLLGYATLARRIGPRLRGRLTAMVLLSMAALHLAAGRLVVLSSPV